MRILAFSLIFLFMSSCMNQHPNNTTFTDENSKKYSTIQVSMNLNFRKYLDYPKIGIKYVDTIRYDTASNQLIFTYDSIGNGVIPVSLFSLLTDGLDMRIHLQHDTSFSFDTNQYAGFKTAKPVDFRDLLSTKADSIYIGQKMVGCFTQSAEKMIITRIGRKYHVSYDSNTGPSSADAFTIQDDVFDEYFKEFIISVRKLFPLCWGKDGFLNCNLSLSTTTYKRYIRVGKTIYEVPDVSEWKEYDKFKQNIGLVERDANQ